MYPLTFLPLWAVLSYIVCDGDNVAQNQFIEDIKQYVCQADIFRVEKYKI